MGRYIQISDVRRAVDLADTGVISDTEVDVAIDATENDFDEWLGTSYSLVTHDVQEIGDGTNCLGINLLYIKQVKNVMCNSGSVNIFDINTIPGGLLLSSGVWAKNQIYKIKLTAGKESVPAALFMATVIEAQRRARVWISRGIRRAGSSQISNEYGQFTLPNWSGKYGPSEDANVMRTLTNLRESGKERFTM